MIGAESLALALRELMEALPSSAIDTGNTADLLELAQRLRDAKRRATEVLAAHTVDYPPTRPRTLLEQYDREQLPGYRAGYEDGRLKGYAVGQRHAAMQTEPLAQPAGGDVQGAEVDALLSRFERHAQRYGELWERCQGKGWPQAASDEFELIRDERLPALKSKLRAMASRLDGATPGRSLMSFDEREELEQQLGVSHQVIEAVEAACAARWGVRSDGAEHNGASRNAKPEGGTHSRPALREC